MKRIISFALALSLIAMIVALSGCGERQSKPGGNKIKIVCTTFPQYDWTRQIIGDKADRFDLTQLIDSRVDLHSYQPSVQDIAKISGSDLFIYIGGESDSWVDNVLKNAVNPNLVAINLLEMLGSAAKKEEVVEGMQAAEHGHDDDDGHHSGDTDHKKGHHHNHHAKNHNGHDDHNGQDGADDDHKHAHNDEHIWLSLRNAQTLGSVIAAALSRLDRDNAATYQQNLAAYIEKLSALDEEYKAAVNAASVKTLLFADRFPFRYLADDYGLKYYAAFSGCSAESEASFETIAFLVRKVDELNLRSVMVTESADQSIARTVVNGTRGKAQQIRVLNAAESVTSADVRNGATYLSIMEANLNVLREALK